jgi:hypothetical protein
LNVQSYKKHLLIVIYIFIINYNISIKQLLLTLDNFDTYIYNFVFNYMYFRDLTTLSRQGNVEVSNQGLKWFASCGFGVSVACLQYENYVVSY